MSEPVAKQRPMIDIDEFERRLRQPPAAPRRQNDDPLAELARLVHNQDDPYQDVFHDFQDAHAVEDHRPVRRPEPAMPRMPAAAPYNPQPAFNPQVHAQIHPQTSSLNPQMHAPRGFRAERLMPQAPISSAPMPSAPLPPSMPDAGMRATRGPQSGPNLGGNFAAIEAGLRGSFQPDYRSPAVPLPPAAVEDDDDHWLDHAQAPLPEMDAPSIAIPAPARSHRLLYVTAAVIALGVAGIGGTFAIKRSPASPQQIAMIKASTSPAKVQAAEPADGSAQAMQDASVLDKTPQPAPTGVVNRAEQPVDLAVSGPKPSAPAPGSAASVPVPTPPTESAPWEAPPGGIKPPQVADASGQGVGFDGLIQTRKVKTVTVRPDGSVVAEDPPAQPTQTALPADPMSAAPTAVKPVGDLPKTAGRASSKIANGAPAGVSSEPAAADPSPVTAQKPRAAARTKPTKLASVDPAASAAADTSAADSGADSGSGGFAVQLAAAPSEAEAEHVMNKLARQYGGTLSGHKLKFHRAKVNDKSVFRVRVGGLTKGSAVQLCEALKAKGGTCFIAHD